MDYKDLLKSEYIIPALSIIAIIAIIVLLFCNCKETFSSSVNTEPVEVVVTPIEYDDAPQEINNGPTEEIKTEYIEGPPVTDSFYVPEPFDVASEMSPLMDSE